MLRKIEQKSEPILVQENYRENGELKSIFQYYDKDPKKVCLVPRWAMVLSSALFTFILIGLIAALAVVYFGRRPSLYGEICVNGRNCIKGLDLKCLNGVCLCDAGYYYSNKCEPKKNYLEQCHLQSDCKDNMNMVCKDGLCKCDSYNYWNGSCCVNSNLIDKKCKADVECITDTVLYCDTNLGLCKCDTHTRYWDGVSCYPRRTYNERCSNDTAQCIGWQNLICQNGLCVCNSTQYWDWPFTVCLNKHFENDTCTSTNQCFSPMNCTNAGKCQCGAFQYHDYSTLTCKPQKSFNVSCSVDFNCRVDKYLGCYNGYCSCIPQIPTWSYGFDSCIISATYDKPCYSTTDCKNTSNLVCNDGTYTCVCPTRTKTGKCDCIRAVGNEYYWDWADNCRVARSFNQTCFGTGFDYMCKTMTEGTYCASSGLCSCQNKYYFNFISSTCQSQLMVNKPCTQSDACRTDLGLTCQFGVCLCNEPTKFWSSVSGQCIFYSIYSQGCSSSSECKPGTGLSCRTSTSILTCSCPTGLGLKTCDCPPRTDNNEYYWDGSSCVLAGYYGDKCMANYQCQTIKGFVCSGNICQCPTNAIWKSHTAYCLVLTCPGGGFLKGPTIQQIGSSYYCFSVVVGDCESKGYQKLGAAEYQTAINTLQPFPDKTFIYVPVCLWYSGYSMVGHTCHYGHHNSACQVQIA